MGEGPTEAVVFRSVVGLPMVVGQRWAGGVRDGVLLLRRAPQWQMTMEVHRAVAAWSAAHVPVAAFLHRIYPQ